MKTIQTAFLFLFSAGWLVPLYYSFEFQFFWLDTEVAPSIYHKIPQMNSFPLLYYSKLFWTISFFWMCAVIVFWFFILVFFVNKINNKINENRK